MSHLAMQGQSGLAGLAVLVLNFDLAVLTKFSLQQSQTLTN